MDKTKLTAETILTAFHDISETATADLRELKPVSVLNPNENFDAFESNRKTAQKTGLNVLKEIPAKFRCVLSHGVNGETKTVYVSPGYDFSAFSDSKYQVINNVSPVGRLANQADVGQKIGVGDWVLIEKQSFTPQKNGISWDGKKNIFYDEDKEKHYSSLKEIEAIMDSSTDKKEKDIINVIEGKIPSDIETNDIFVLLKENIFNERDTLADISSKLNKIFLQIDHSKDNDIKYIYKKWIEIIKKYAKGIKEKLSFYEKQGRTDKINELTLILKKSDEKIELLSNTCNLMQKLESPIDEYAKTIHNRYSQFLDENKMDLLNSRGNRISFTERDILSLAILKIFKAFSKNNYLFHKNKALENFSKNISKLQIFVDEMTDFSPLQISGMFQLSDKNMNSFFAGGDFNQRLTTYGCSNKKDLYWALGNSLRLKEIKKNYRLSPKLSYLSSMIINELSDVDITSNEYIQSPNPIWLKNESNLDTIAEWIVRNICEIFNRFNDFPSIAVLVGNEADVIPTAKALEDKGNDVGLRVEACVLGQSIGTETNVRVFDIHHIKGLEFEAAFFISLDQMFSKNPSDIVRYLYVGATRAANFLGITTSTAYLSKNLEQCASLFKDVF